MKKEKILLRENTAQAESFIQQLESGYLESIRWMISELKNLGIKDLALTKELFLEIINRSYSNLYKLYWEIAQADVDKFSTPAARSKAKSEYESLVAEFTQDAQIKFSLPGPDNSPLSDPSFQLLWSLDESGKPIIASEIKAQIFENFKTYAEDPLHIKVHQLQEKTAKDLEDLLKNMKEAGFLKDYFLPTPWLALSQIFEVSQKESGQFIIDPKVLDFPKPEAKDEGNTEPDVMVTAVNTEPKDVYINKKRS